MDMIVKNAMVVTLDEGLGIIENGIVSIHDGRIKTVEKNSASLAYKADKIIDAQGGIIMPGLVNCLAQGATTLFRGLPAENLHRLSRFDIPLLSYHSDPAGEITLKGARLAAIEMIRSGTTSFCDSYSVGDAACQAALEAGLRTVVGATIDDEPSPGYGNREDSLSHIMAMMDKWIAAPRITVAAALHENAINTPELITKAAGLAKESATPLIMTIARTRQETVQTKKNNGKTAVSILESLGILGPNLVLCHGAHLDRNDINLLKKYDVNLIHCPERDMAPVPELLEQGICVGLGTGGYPGSHALDLFLEMDTAAKLHKVFSMDPEVLDAKSCVKMATTNGATALGLNTGTITPGKCADIIVIDTSKPHSQPLYNPYSHLVYSASGHDVSTVIIDGKIIMENRSILTVDIEQVMEEAKAASLELQDRLGTD